LPCIEEKRLEVSMFTSTWLLQQTAVISGVGGSGASFDLLTTKSFDLLKIWAKSLKIREVSMKM